MRWRPPKTFKVSKPNTKPYRIIADDLQESKGYYTFYLNDFVVGRFSISDDWVITEE